MIQKRLKKILLCFAVMVAAGILYGAFVELTGFAIPCIFHLVTGLKCPGCGVTQMSMDLMHLDFESAFYCNQMLFLLLPVLSIVFLKYIVDYVKTGCFHMGRVQTGIIYISIILLLLFAITRNIARF